MMNLKGLTTIMRGADKTYTSEVNLIGSEKQVEWAEKIRATVIDGVMRFEEKVRDKFEDYNENRDIFVQGFERNFSDDPLTPAEDFETQMQKLINKSEAKFWIDNFKNTNANSIEQVGIELSETERRL